MAPRLHVDTTMRAPFDRLPLTGILASACLLPLQACSMSYRAEPIEAWVVDSDSGRPVEGTIVTANWELEEGTPGGNRPAGQLMIMETVTDGKGRFYFPAWGPKSTPLAVPGPFSSAPHLVNLDPQILMFKPGYKWVALANYPVTDYNKSSVRKSEWNGKTIKIERFKGSPAEYAKHLRFLSGSLDFALSPDLHPDPCDLKKVARMAVAIHLQGKDFERLGIPNQLLSLDYYLIDPRYKDECGVRDALRKLLP